jgi:hypothetical protein
LRESAQDLKAENHVLTLKLCYALERTKAEQAVAEARRRNRIRQGDYFLTVLLNGPSSQRIVDNEATIKLLESLRRKKMRVRPPA